MEEPSREHYLTMNEYQPFNVRAEWRHEYARGRMWPQGNPDGEPASIPKAGLPLGQIKSNILAGLDLQLAGQIYQISASDQQVWHERAQFAAFPDIVAFREDAERKKRRGLDSLLNPRVIIEILSPSTANFDREEMFAYYRLFPSLRDYLLIRPDKYLVEQFHRTGEGNWTYEAYWDAGTMIELKSIGCRLALSEVYSRIQFPPSENRWLKPDR